MNWEVIQPADGSLNYTTHLSKNTVQGKEIDIGGSKGDKLCSFNQMVHLCFAILPRFGLRDQSQILLTWHQIYTFKITEGIRATNQTDWNPPSIWHKIELTIKPLYMCLIPFPSWCNWGLWERTLGMMPREHREHSHGQHKCRASTWEYNAGIPSRTENNIINLKHANMTSENGTHSGNNYASLTIRWTLTDWIVATQFRGQNKGANKKQGNFQHTGAHGKHIRISRGKYPVQLVVTAYQHQDHNHVIVKGIKLTRLLEQLND